MRHRSACESSDSNPSATNRPTPISRPPSAPTAKVVPNGKLWLRLLGGSAAGIHPDNALLTGGKALGVLAYLSCAPRRRADRERLLDYLWADLDRANARGALRSALHWLKRRCNTELFTADGDALILDESVTSDRDAFLAAIERDDLPMALEIYGGDFLSGFAAPGAREFEEWADGERLRLRRLFVHAAEQHVRQLLSIGRSQDAATIAKRARDADPWVESAWRLYLEALIAAQEMVWAATEADALERLLSEEEREPEPATRALMKLARKATPTDDTEPARVSLHAELIGRSREFSRIMMAWDGVRAGQAAHLHLNAPPGLGKTRLLDDVGARLRAGRARVVHVRAQPGERALDFAFAAAIARALAGLPGAAGVSSESAAALVALNPTLSSVWNVEPDRSTDAECRRRRAMALSELIESVAHESPVAVLLDDLHWADPSSWLVLQSPFARIAGHHVLLVTTARPSSVPASHERLQEMALEPLVADEIGELVASLGPLPNAPWAQELPTQLLNASQGQPLLVLSVLQDLLDEQLLERSAAVGWSAPRPDALASALAAGRAQRRRIEVLDRPERWLLLLLAVAGIPLEQVHLLEAAQIGQDRGGEVLRLLEMRGLALSTDNGAVWSPGHDSIAEDSVALATPDALRAAHTAIGRLFATTLRDRPGMVSQAGPHLVAGDDRATLTRAYRTLVTRQRQSGVRFTPRGAARELLGSAWSATEEDALLRALPWRQRPILRQLTAVGAGIMLVAAGAVAARLSSAGGADARAYPMLLRSDGRASTLFLLPRDVFETSGAVDVAALERTPRTWPDTFQVNDRSPDGRTLAGIITVGGERTSDVALWSPDSGLRVPSPAARDDGGGLWSPDGALVAFATARWSPKYHYYKIGILEVATGTVRQLSPPDSMVRDAEIGWTPDGATFVFARFAMVAKPNQLCRIGRDGSDMDCVDLPERVSVSAGAVVDAHRVSLLLRNGSATWISRFDWSTRTLQRIADATGATTLSRDGRVAYCGKCTPDGRAQLILVSSDDIRRDVILPTSAAWDLVHWLDAPPRQPIRALRFLSTFRQLTVGEAHQFRVSARDSAGTAVEANRIRWTSRDPSVLSIDRGGTGRALREGRTWLVADAYGLAVDSMPIVVVSGRPRLVVGPRTVREWSRDFVFFGDPIPEVLPGAGGALGIEVPSDDPSYPSGLLSVNSFDIAAGVFVEAEVTVPNTRYQWQSANISLVRTDSAAWEAWDKRNGALPLALPACFAGLPLGEGYSQAGRASVGIDGDSRDVDLPAGTESAPHRLHIALLPDGRCGVAIGGRPVFIGAAKLPADARVRLLVNMKSYASRVRVRDVTVWTGVKSDYDWSLLDARARGGAAIVRKR